MKIGSHYQDTQSFFETRQSAHYAVGIQLTFYY